jgi:V8-like Glu-specific endopeptidase
MTVRLEGRDLQDLITILEKYNSFSDMNALKFTLHVLNFQWLIPELNPNQSPRMLIFSIVQRLSERGQDQFGNEALGRFLNGLVDGNYVEDSSDKRFLQSLIQKYRMMPTVSIGPEKPLQRIPQIEESNTLEKIIGENTLRPIAFLSRAIDVSNCVCFIGYPGDGGTGFLVGENLVITNNHVIHDVGQLSQCFFRFNYQLGVDGSPMQTTDYKAKEGGFFHTNPSLDYTIIELENSPGTKWGYSKLLSTVNVKPKESRVNIIQHPGGGPKQISLQNNFLEYMDDKVIQYVTSTLNGSSGSPVFDDQWNVVGLHHSGGMIIEPSSGRKYFRNEGILIPTVLSTLPDSIKGRL